MIRWANSLVTKKAGVMMALLASVITLLSVASFLPGTLRIIFHSLSIGLAVGLAAVFGPAYSDDMRRYPPFGKQFLSRAFFGAYLVFIVILGIVTISRTLTSK